MTRQEYKEIYDVVGAAMEVYNTLGRGMAEPVYQEALALEFEMRGMDVEREKKLTLFYKDIQMQKTYYADFYYKGVLVELKSVDELCSEHRAQLFNYMRITRKHRGVLLHYGEKGLHTERYLYLPEDDDFVLLNQDNYKLYIDSDH